MSKENPQDLINELQALRQENAELKKRLLSLDSIEDTVSVPEAFKPIFDAAQKTVGQYFQKIKSKPDEGTLEINNERYVLLRASSLSVGFMDKMKDLYSDYGKEDALKIGRNFLFDIAHVLGIEDAQNFHQKMGLEDPISKLSAGPVHFAYTGWAYVDILGESQPSPDENFYLKYHHPFSFEADSWIKERGITDHTVCIMNSGYSSGWCEESFGIPLTAVEVECRAKGDDNCTFIMAHPNKIEDHLRQYHQGEEHNHEEVPYFFERQKAEMRIKQNLKEKNLLLKEVHHRVKNNLQIISSLLNLQTHYFEDKKSIELFKQTKNRIKTLALVHEKLQQASDIEQVNLEEYIQSIVELLSYSYDNRGKNIKINLDFDASSNFEIDKAIPCGLIVNELVSNSIEHAFQNQQNGIINLKLRKEGEQFSLLISDNGSGIPEGYKIDKNESLGSEIVSSLVEQLNGKIESFNDEGCNHLITF